MGRVITKRGFTLGQIRGNKSVSLGEQTLDSNFADPNWRDRFPDEGYPWTADQESGAQTTINHEQQYYVKASDPTLTGDAANLISVNSSGNLVLKCVETPVEFEDTALGIIDEYTVTTVNTADRSFTVAALDYYEPATETMSTTPADSTRDTFTIINVGTAASRSGVNRYLRDNVNGDSPSVGKSKVFTYGWIRRKSGTHVKYESIDDVLHPPLTSGTPANDVRIKLVNDTDLPPVGEKIKVLRRLPYVSAMVTTRGAHAQKFGTWRVRVKLPGGKGSFAAAWSWPNYKEITDVYEYDKEDKDVEIDFIEQLGHAPIQYHNAHQPDHNNLDYAALNGLSPIYNSWNADGSAETLQFPSGLQGTIEGGDKSEGEGGGSINVNTLVGKEWDKKHIQQHQVRLHDGQIDFSNTWQEVIWDWYPDNTCAWFVKVGDSGVDANDFIEVAHMHMSPRSNNGKLDERMTILNNAFDSKFNREQEFFDKKRNDFVGEESSPHLFEVDYVRVNQWNEANGWVSGTPGYGTNIYQYAPENIHATSPISTGGTILVTKGSRYGSTSGEIFWNKASYTQFNVYRDDVLMTTSSYNTGNSYFDNGLTAGQIHVFEVKAIDSGGSEVSLGTVTLPSETGTDNGIIGAGGASSSGTSGGGGASTGAVTVTGNSINLPDDGGWYQIQDSTTYASIYEGPGDVSEIVVDGTYNVINLTTGFRNDGVVVPPISSANPPAIFTAEAFSGSAIQFEWGHTDDTAHGGAPTSFELFIDGASSPFETKSSYVTGAWVDNSSVFTANHTHQFELVAVYSDGARSDKVGPISLKMDNGETSTTV